MLQFKDRSYDQDCKYPLYFFIHGDDYAHGDATD